MVLNDTVLSRPTAAWRYNSGHNNGATCNTIKGLLKGITRELWFSSMERRLRKIGRKALKARFARFQNAIWGFWMYKNWKVDFVADVKHEVRIKVVKSTCNMFHAGLEITLQVDRTECSVELILLKVFKQKEGFPKSWSRSYACPL